MFSVNPQIFLSYQLKTVPTIIRIFFEFLTKLTSFISIFNAAVAIVVAGSSWERFYGKLYRS